MVHEVHRAHNVSARGDRIVAQRGEVCPEALAALPRLRVQCYTARMPTFRYEIQLGRKSGAVICGVDEAGRGPLAGPVVACAAILPLTGLLLDR